MTVPHPPHSTAHSPLPTTSPIHARRTAPAITVSTIAAELHTRYPAELPTQELAVKLVQQSLSQRGYTNISEDSAVWSSNREQILDAFRRHYEESE